MSEVTPNAPAVLKTPAPGAEKRLQVEKLLTDILKLMDFPAKLDFQDAADGGIAVAVHFQGEVPASPPGKRNYLIDSIQFLVNKVVNRPNTEKRWVSLGMGAFPEPKLVAAPQAAPAQARAPKQNGHPNGQAQSQAPAQAPARPSTPPRATKREPLENTVDVAPDPVLEALGKTLAEKSAKLGRFYAVTMMGVEDRARLLKATASVKGVTANAEGEDYLRRVLFVPAKPTAMPKKQVMPDYPDDDE
ncbi:MAG: hypothetical protein K1X64_10635 [Myxococcaceae bacterium]|nr:hypothetical protein [Myxococcaceae bacterium]